MTTILTPVEKLEAHMEFMIGATLYAVSSNELSAWTPNTAYPMFSFSHLKVIFPDGVPVIQPDKPKEVRCVVTVDEDGTPRVDGEICVSVGDWLDILLENNKTYDLVLTEREVQP